MKAEGIGWPQIADGKYLDSRIALLYNVRSAPTYYVIGRDGKIVTITSMADGLREMIGEALRGEGP